MYKLEQEVFFTPRLPKNVSIVIGIFLGEAPTSGPTNHELLVLVR